MKTAAAKASASARSVGKKKPTAPLEAPKPRWGDDRMERLVAPEDRHTGPSVSWRSVQGEERAEIVAEVKALVRESLEELKSAPPTGDEYATLLKLRHSVVISGVAARKAFASKKAIVAHARDLRRRRKSRQTQAYVRRCAAKGVAPGWLAGRDGRAWA